MGPLEVHANVLSVAYSPNGQHIISGSTNKFIQVWNAKTGDAVGTPLVPRVGVFSVAYSPDEQHVICGSTDWTI